MLRSVCICLALVSFTGTANAGDARPVVFRTKTMGTWASLTLVTADSAAVTDLAYDALTVLHRVDSLMSNWTNDSEVARINRDAAPYEIEVHPEVGQVLAFAQRVNRESNGAFDITVEPLVRLWGFLGGDPRVPSQQEIDAVLETTGHDKLRFDADSGLIHFVRDGVKIDLGGIAKGYGVDRVADVLRAAGASNALVDLSGNMVAIGQSADGDRWAVGLRDPRGEHDFLGRIHLSDEAIATSADYEQFVDDDGKRYGHILDPRTGWSARGLGSVTIVTPHAMTADAWATALFVLGSDAARTVARERDDLDVILVEPRSDGPDIIWVETTIKARFTLKSGVNDTHIVRFF